MQVKLVMHDDLIIILQLGHVKQTVVVVYHECAVIISQVEMSYVTNELVMNQLNNKYLRDYFAVHDVNDFLQFVVIQSLQL
jgi:hypothetical protein